MKAITTLAGAAVGGLIACSEPGLPSTLLAPPVPTAEKTFMWDRVSAIAFVSTRHDPTANPLLAAEIYLMDGDGTNARRLTENSDGDGFPALSPDGKKIVFDSNRLRAEGEPLNTLDLFVRDVDGVTDAWVARGSSATWSPDSKDIAFHASASGTGQPIKPDPGAATFDSDIFVANVDDVLAGVAAPRNITNDPTAIDDDPDWSPELADGQKIVFTSHPVTDNHTNSVNAEIYVINADGTGTPTRLTFNNTEERAAAWSPDGTRIVYMCKGFGTGLGADFEICVMNADGTGQAQLTVNLVPDLAPTWSPDGTEIVFHRPVLGRFQLFKISANGTGLVQMTSTEGINGFPNWGVVRERSALVAAP